MVNPLISNAQLSHLLTLTSAQGFREYKEGEVSQFLPGIFLWSSEQRAVWKGEVLALQ